MMKKRLPWTKARIIFAILAVIAFIITIYGIWMTIDGQNFGKPTGDPTSVNAIGGIFLMFTGFAISFLAGSLTVVFVIAYVLIIRNLKKDKN